MCMGLDARTPGKASQDRGLRIKEPLYRRPIFSHDVFGLEMAASRKKFEGYTCAPGKTIHKFPWNVRIIFCMEHQYLGRRNFLDVMHRVVKYAIVKFIPVRGREPVSVAESSADVCG